MMKNSNYMGVSRIDFKYMTKFSSCITVNYKRIYLGLFYSDVEAAIAWDNYVKFNNLRRNLNFPDPEPENLIPNTRLIRLTQGKFAIVDEEDFERVNQYRWCTHNHGNTSYAIRGYKNDNKSCGVKMHRFVLNFPDTSIDHINGNGLDNRKCNLRVCTHSMNMGNRSSNKDSCSKYKGVYYHKVNRKFVSELNYGGNRIYLGSFTDETEAAKAYDIKAKELYGEFAKLNLL